MEIALQLTQTPKEKPSDDILGFGTYFTDHMFLMDYDVKNGWHNARIEPFHAFCVASRQHRFHITAQKSLKDSKHIAVQSGGVQLFSSHGKCPPHESLRCASVPAHDG